VGDDAFAGAALELLKRDGVDLGLVRRVERPTGCAAIMVGESSENLIAVAPGANAEAVASAVPDEVLGPGTIVLCQMEVPAAETAALIHRAAARGARIVLNLAPALAIGPGLPGDLDLLVANETEAITLGGDPDHIAQRLRHGFVVTPRAAGPTAFLAGGEPINLPVPA